MSSMLQLCCSFIAGSGSNSIFLLEWGGETGSQGDRPAVPLATFLITKNCEANVAFQPVANCTMCHLRWTFDGQLCEITQAFRWTGSVPTAGELVALATALGGLLTTRLRNVMSSRANMTEVYCRNIHDAVSAEGTYAIPQPAPGTRGSAPLAGNEAIGIIRRTGFTGRTHHGRNSISCFGQDDVDGNTIVTALLTLLVQLAGQMLTTYVGGKFTPAVASKHLGVATNLLGVAVNNSWVDSQKTRLTSHGR